MKSKSKSPRLWLTGVLAGMAFCATAGAQAPEKPPLEQVEAMVILNENGIIAVTYAEPWFWEVGYYAMSLYSIMTDSLTAAHDECTALTQTLTDHPDRRLSDRARRVLDSQMNDGQIDPTRLISSVLKKYSRNNEIDPENPSDKGTYRGLTSNVCSNLDDVDAPGYLQQMFPRPADNPERFYDPQCVKIQQTTACLDRLILVDTLNRRTQDEFTAVDISPDIFSVVSGKHVDDEV